MASTMLVAPGAALAQSGGQGRDSFDRDPNRRPPAEARRGDRRDDDRRGGSRRGERSDRRDQPEDAAQVDDVVVTASATGVNVRDAPASISVITREEIERQPVRSVGELLGRLPGVTGGLSPSGALSKITIRGMPDGYTLMLVDGRRIGNASTLSYRPDLGRQDLNWISPDMIERIEVVRGPMSSLYGSDAMGGVINIVTRRIPPTWRGSANASYTLPEDSDRGDAYQLGFNLAGPLADVLGVRLGATYGRTEPDEVVIGDGRTENAGASGIANTTVNGLLTYRPVERHVFSLEASYGLEEPLAPDTLRGTAAQTAFGAETERTSLRLGHEGEWGFGTSRLDVYRNAFENKDGGDGGFTAESEELIVEGLFNFSLNLGFEHKIAVGGQYRDEELTNTQILGTVPVDPNGNPVSGATLSGDTLAVFAEDQVTLRDNLFLTLGARLDSHDRYGEHVSPRAYLVWHPTATWTIRGGVSQGFRAPSISESSAGAATNSRGGGCGGLIGMVDDQGRPYTNQGCWMTGNPDLKPEESTNYEIGVAFDQGGNRLGLTYFHTNFENKIEYTPLGYFHGRWWTQRENIQEARTRGLEVNGVSHLGPVTLRGNATWMMEAKNLVTGADLITTPEWSLYGSADWQAAQKLNLMLSAQYTGRQLGGGNTITDEYVIFDLTGAYEVRETVTLRAGVQNLLDEEITGTSGFAYYTPGRRFFVSVNSRF